MTYTAVLIAGGGTLFVTAIHDRQDSERRLVVGGVTAAALLAAVATIAGIVFYVAELGVGGAAARDPRMLSGVLQSPVGVSTLVRLGALALLLATVPAALAGRARLVALAGGAGAVLSFLLAGHTVTAEPRWLALLADAGHTLAASVWFGGLVFLGLVLRRRRTGDPVDGATVVARFSAWATCALAGVVVGGLALAWVEVRTVPALTTTAYGRTLAAKVAIAGAVAVVGAYNNRLLVPTIVRASRAPVDGAGARAWRRLGYTVRVEALGLAAALAVTAVLVSRAPPRPTAAETTSIVPGTAEPAGGGPP